MSFSGIKKRPLNSIPFLKKRLQRISALGIRNLTVNEIHFTVYFTLHRNEKTVAFFTSESVENQHSPEWSYLQFPTTVQRLQDFFMRIWITSSNTTRLFLEYDIHLDDSLVPEEQKTDSYRNNDSLWLEMFGYRFTDNDNQKPPPIMEKRPSLTEKKSKRDNRVKSYNKLSILRMVNAIDAIRTRNRSAAHYFQRLQTLFKENEEYLSKVRDRESRHVRIANLRQHLFIQISIYERAFNSNLYRQKLINERKNRLEQNALISLNQQEELNSLLHNLDQSKCLLHDLLQLINFRQKDLISEIYRYVYPITIENKIEYAIGNIKLPPAEDKTYLFSMTRERENEIEAAVGFCAHIILIISQFMQIPLRFPIDYYSSSLIKIHDYSQPTSEFPLHPVAGNTLFDYGLFLLNRNIGQIMYHCHMTGRQIDHRKTLENLKNLMEQYFLNTNSKTSIQLFASNQQLIESANSSGRHLSFTERPIMRNQRNLTLNPIFSSSSSDISSIPETNDDHDIGDLYRTINTKSLRLSMQYSQQH